MLWNLGIIFLTVIVEKTDSILVITYPHKRYWYNFAVAHTLAEYKGIFRGTFNRELIGAGNSLCETCFPCARGKI